jgi:DNA-binding NtrC family response regulator
MAKILVIDDEESLRFTFEHFLREAGHAVTCASTYDEACERLADAEWDLIFSDIILEGHTGIEILRLCGEAQPGCPVVMITGYPTVETATEALRLGAFDYVAKPVEMEALLRVTGLALQHKKLVDEREEYRSRLDTIFTSVEDGIITVDRRLVLTEVNNASKRMCGFTPEAAGTDIRALNLGCNGQCLELLKGTVEKRQSWKGVRLECGPPERRKVVNVSTYPLVDRRTVFTGAVMVIRDETRLATLERDLSQRQRLHNILGKSRRMQQVYSLVEALADVDTTVLVTGESGTGKELVAEALHQLGSRRERPLIKVNCSALSESLLESELFGHVKGAFTGAVSERIGRFQRAEAGTVFLDEIGDLSPRVQAALLRVLQEKEFDRVGDSTPIRLRARIVTATNKDLREKVKRGEFREDLLHRLRVVEITLPPLRSRSEDIPLLVEHFLTKFTQKIKKDIVAVSAGVHTLFLNYAWPGNVRELEHAIEHAVVVCDQSTITVDHLPSHIRDALKAQALVVGDRDAKPQALIQALEKTAWNKKRAARLLGIDRKTLYRQLAKYHIVMPSDDPHDLRLQS